MSEEPSAPGAQTVNYDDIVFAWENLAPGPKARAMRSVFEEQNKLVTELQRQHMEMTTEIAICVVRARAAEELHQESVKRQIIENEVRPKVQEQEMLGLKIQENQRLLDAYTTLGKGII